MTLLCNSLQLPMEHAWHKENASSTISAQTPLRTTGLGTAGGENTVGWRAETISCVRWMWMLELGGSITSSTGRGAGVAQGQKA